MEKNIARVEWGRSQAAYYRLSDTRQAYLYDAVLSLSGVDRNSAALDFGCGSGEFLTKWLAGNVRSAHGYDIDDEGVRLANSGASGLENVSATTDMRLLPSDFDVAFLNAVWMTLPTYDSCLNALIAIRRHVKKGGKLVASVTHPCFRDLESRNRRTDFERQNYFLSGRQFRVSITGSDGSGEVSFSDHHWTLTDLSRQLQASGWSNMRLVEIPDQEKGFGLPGPQENLNTPIWLVVLAERLT